MFEEKKFRIVLISGGFAQWSNTITPLLLTQTDSLTIVETVEELNALPPDAYPEMIAVCHNPDVFDGITAAKNVREIFPVTPLVLLAIENIVTLKAALEIGALSILEPPFDKIITVTVINRCRQLAAALTEDALRHHSKGCINTDSKLLTPEISTLEWLETTPDASENGINHPNMPLLAANTPPPPPQLATNPVSDISAAGDTHSASLSSLKILVAEDIPMLQTIIKNLLESIGCRYTLVGNGKAVLDEWEKGGFDVILMDLRMPVMDGFAATRHIRTRELATGDRIPIVALSSYSLQDIMDKCQEIGMDSYLLKPVEKEKLEETLRWLIIPHDIAQQSEIVRSSLNGLPVLDVHATLENLGSDLDFYRELIHIYLETCAGLGDELADILGENDLKNIRNTAHSLKGIVSNIGGKRLAEVARQIQDMCHLGNKPFVAVWAPLVRTEAAALKSAMETLCWDELRQSICSSTSENR
jgi:CheY-like chemotaxis protein